jgi:thymidine kinase
MQMGAGGLAFCAARPNRPRAMSKVYFYYSAMNAGKSTVLLQSSYNYRERGMRTLLFVPALDTRAGQGRIESRIGLASEAVTLEPADDLLERVRREHAAEPVACVLVDEAQFLTGAQVRQATDVADTLRIPVLCYGLRTDFQGRLFPGSAELLALADNLTELKTICHCGRKATMNLRVGADGKAVREGAQVEIGGNDRYVAMCRRHFKEAFGPA